MKWKGLVRIILVQQVSRQNNFSYPVSHYTGKTMNHFLIADWLVGLEQSIQMLYLISQPPLSTPPLPSTHTHTHTHTLRVSVSP